MVGSGGDTGVSIGGTRPLLRFHLRGAAGVAQRNILATLAGIIVLLAFVPDAPGFVRQVAVSLAGHDAPRVPALLVALVMVIIAAEARPALTLGLGGWLRSLPLAQRQHRRAVTVGLLLPLAPVLVAELLAIVALPAVYGVPLGAASLAGMPAGALAAAASAIPVRRGWIARPLALAALALSVQGTWLAAAGAIAGLALWDAVAGPIALPRRDRPRSLLADHALGVVLVWRALGLRLFRPLVSTGVLLGAAWLYRVNNGLSVAEAGFVTRTAVLVALLLGMSSLGNGLLARRRPWPWARSLPWTAARRVGHDAIAIAAPPLATLLVAARLDWRAAAAGALTLPLLAVLTAGAVRRSSSRILGVSGELVVAGGLAVALVALWPALSVVALVAAPLVLALGARAERRLVATGWEELHHTAAGDSLTASAR